jgi:hypothetical protein
MSAVIGDISILRFSVGLSHNLGIHEVQQRDCSIRAVFEVFNIIQISRPPLLLVGVGSS